MSVFRVDGQVLNLLVKATRARSVLELGTSQGYSALWLALALEESGGHLTTVDQRPERIELARQNLGRAGLLHRVTFRDGDAHHLLALIDGPFDFVFLDADKGGNFDYFQKLYPKKLLAGGLLVARKAISMRDAMKQYLQALEQHPAFDAVILNLPTGDNFSVAYRKRK
jgi:predicted O-methyltransferase YrrM